MTILHYSDKADPHFLEKYKQCDVLIATGDLTFSDFAGIETVEPKKPAAGVYGNHDSGSYLGELGIANLHNKVMQYANLTWGGFQGCLRYKKSELMYSEEDAQRFYESFPHVDILLLHAGGKDMLDDPSDAVHTGSIWIARYIQEKQPKIVFCGHQYSDAQLQVGPTVIYRSFGSRFITI